MGRGQSVGSLVCLLLAGAQLARATPGGPCLSAPESAAFLPPVTCSKERISQALRGTAPCQARDKVIRVPWPNNSSVDQLTPSHVTVRRCSGGCQRQTQHCVPTGTHKRKIPVLLGRCPLGGGKCQKECAEIEVEDHTSCSCGCRQEEQSCSIEQQFDRDSCTCTCRDRSAMTSCLETGRSWDSSSCSCLCPPSKTCGGDQVMDPSTCGCLLKDVHAGKEKNGKGREERSEEQEEPFLLNLRLKWEYPVILTLASLNLFLICIIVVLARRHRNLKRKLNNKARNLPDTVVGNLYSPCPSKEIKGGKKEVKNDGTGGDIQLYPSDSDISSEQQSSEGSEKGGGRGATDSSYCSYSQAPHVEGLGGSYSPAPPPAPCHHNTPLHYTGVQQPVHSVGLPSFTEHPQYSEVQLQYSTVQAHYSPVQPCCPGYMASLSSLPRPSTFSPMPSSVSTLTCPTTFYPPPSSMPSLPHPSSLPLDCSSETASLLGRETPL